MMLNKKNRVERFDKKFKFNASSREDLKFFIKNGFVVYHNIYEKKVLNESKNYLLKLHSSLKKKYRNNSKFNAWKWADYISEKFDNSDCSKKLYKSERLLYIIRKFLGPDIGMLNKKCLYIIDPKLKNYSTKLNPHVDAWQGNSIDTIQLNTYYTNADRFNSMLFYPGSHLLGLLPSKNRNLDPSVNIDIKPYYLNNIKSGDIVVFHPFILHGTAISNSSKVKFRMAIGDRFKSLNKKFTSQEISLGYKVVSLGPINHITRIIGNDYASPFRVMGGPAKINEALHDLYDLC